MMEQGPCAVPPLSLAMLSFDCTALAAHHSVVTGVIDVIVPNFPSCNFLGLPV
jgi:hypothetical protein